MNLVSKSDLRSVIFHKTESCKLPVSFLSWIDEWQGTRISRGTTMARAKFSRPETNELTRQACLPASIKQNVTQLKYEFYSLASLVFPSVAVSSVYPCLVASVSTSSYLLYQMISFQWLFRNTVVEFREHPLPKRRRPQRYKIHEHFEAQ